MNTLPKGRNQQYISDVQSGTCQGPQGIILRNADMYLFIKLIGGFKVQQLKNRFQFCLPFQEVNK